MNVKNFLSKEQQEAIVAAIENAENATSGEVRVHIESSCKADILDRTAQVFSDLKMHKTALRNGVLIYLAVNDRKFAIIGDTGINSKVPTGFWDEIQTAMTSEFIKNEFANGLIKGIEMVGEKLKTFFPVADDDINELSNEISFGS